MIPFIMTTFGDVDKHTHAFLTALKKRDPYRAARMMDVLSVQHAKWIATRLRRCLGFYNKDFSSPAVQGASLHTYRPHHHSKRGEFPRLAHALGFTPQPSPRAPRARRGTRRTAFQPSKRINA